MKKTVCCFWIVCAPVMLAGFAFSYAAVNIPIDYARRVIGV